MKTGVISPADQKDIQELAGKIDQFKSGEMHEERFRHFRLTRGVYGQRQAGVQMFRTKLPFGKVTTHQLEVLADLAEKYGHNNLHITTRQNIQLHFVKVENSVEVWKGLTANGMTAMGACGNTVRNITASETAGIDPEELFDVSPYVQRTFEYFLRNPICQDMGRKIKMAFSSSDKDSGYTYFHDFGFIPRIQEVDGKPVKGFKVVIGGGLGAQSIVAPTVYEFLPAQEILSFIEAGLRVFDRHGEREKRHKARMKFLVKKLGVEAFMELVEQERTGAPDVKLGPIPEEAIPELPDAPTNHTSIDDQASYEQWLETNTFEQKQKGFYGVYLKIHLGDLKPELARKLTPVIRAYAADDIRLTVGQNLLLRFVPEASLASLYTALKDLGLTESGIGSIGDITACPGTDTCALGVTNSTALATELKQLIYAEFQDLLTTHDINIKISGCMNSCGQHMAAGIGFHGSSIKHGVQVIPAMQVVVGGGIDEATGEGFVAQRVIKLPTRRIPEAVRILLDDYAQNKLPGDTYLRYANRQDRRYFYGVLKHLGDTKEVIDYEFFDWGQNRQYIQSIGVGECAGVSYDMVGAILGDAVEKINESKERMQAGSWVEGIYNAYTAMVIAAKGYLLSKDVKCNTHIGIIEDFDKALLEDPTIELEGTFADLVLRMRENEPEEDFAHEYVGKAQAFVREIISNREEELSEDAIEKLVVDSYYKA